jgi:hypothetical protein
MLNDNLDIQTFELAHVSVQNVYQEVETPTYTIICHERNKQKQP